MERGTRPSSAAFTAKWQLAACTSPQRAGTRSAVSTAGCSGPGRNRHPACCISQPGRPTSSSPLTARHAPLPRVLVSIPFPTRPPSAGSSPSLSTLPPKTDRLPGLTLCPKATRTCKGVGSEGRRTDSRAARSTCGPDPALRPLPRSALPLVETRVGRGLLELCRNPGGGVRRATARRLVFKEQPGPELTAHCRGFPWPPCSAPFRTLRKLAQAQSARPGSPRQPPRPQAPPLPAQGRSRRPRPRPRRRRRGMTSLTWATDIGRHFEKGKKKSLPGGGGGGGGGGPAEVLGRQLRGGRLLRPPPPRRSPARARPPAGRPWQVRARAGGVAGRVAWRGARAGPRGLTCPVCPQEPEAAAAPQAATTCSGVSRRSRGPSTRTWRKVRPRPPRVPPRASARDPESRPRRERARRAPARGLQPARELCVRGSQGHGACSPLGLPRGFRALPTARAAACNSDLEVFAETRGSGSKTGVAAEERPSVPLWVCAAGCAVSPPEGRPGLRWSVPACPARRCAAKPLRGAGGSFPARSPERARAPGSPPPNTSRSCASETREFHRSHTGTFCLCTERSGQPLAGCLVASPPPPPRPLRRPPRGADRWRPER